MRWPLTLAVLNKDLVLTAGTNEIEIQPPSGQHWLILNLALEYDAPAVAGVKLFTMFQLARAPGDDRTLERVTLAVVQSDTKTFFPVFNGVWLETTGPIVIAGSPQRFYLPWPHKLILILEGAPAGRPAKIRGLAVQEKSDVSLEGLF